MNWLIIIGVAAFAVIFAVPDKKEEEESESKNPTESKPVSKKRGRPKKIVQEIPPAKEEEPINEEKK